MTGKARGPQQVRFTWWGCACHWEAPWSLEPWRGLRRMGIPRGGDPALLSSSQQDVHPLHPERPAGEPVVRASQGRTGPGCHPEKVPGLPGQGSDLGRPWRGLSKGGVGGAGASLGVQDGLRCVPRCFNHRGNCKTDPSSIYSKCEEVGYSLSTRRACTVCICVCVRW